MPNQTPSAKASESPVPVAVPSYITSANVDPEVKKVLSMMYVEFAEKLPSPVK